jgi:hypothetical protein
MRSLTFTNFHHYLTRSQALFGMGPHAALNAGLKPHMSRTGSGVFIVLSLRFLSGRRQSLDASMPRVFAILFAFRLAVSSQLQIEGQREKREKLR